MKGDSVILNIEIEPQTSNSKQKKQIKNMKRKPFILEENQNSVRKPRGMKNRSKSGRVVSKGRTKSNQKIKSKVKS